MISAEAIFVAIIVVTISVVFLILSLDWFNSYRTEKAIRREAEENDRERWARSKAKRDGCDVIDITHHLDDRRKQLNG